MQVGAGREPNAGAERNVVAFPGASGVTPKLDRAALAALLGGRVRTLQWVCAAMLGTAVLMAVGGVVVVRALAVPPKASLGVSLVLTCAATVLILAASRLHATLLSRARRGAPIINPTAAAAAIADGYSRATIISFVLLDAAAALGMVIAVVTGSARYALVICGAAALGMLARWPHRGAVIRRLRLRGLA